MFTALVHVIQDTFRHNTKRQSLLSRVVATSNWRNLALLLAQAKEVPWLPGLLFGGLSTAAGLLTLLLPETLHRPLPQTIDDIELWYSKKPRDTEHHAADADPKRELHEMRQTRGQ